MESKRVLVRGYQLHVECRTLGSGFPTVFFFHGSMANLRHFKGIWDISNCNIVAYDALGCGASDKPQKYEAYSTDRLTEDAIYIFHLYATSRNFLVGHSFGAVLCSRVNREMKTVRNINGAILIGTAESMKSGGHPVFMLPTVILKCLEPILSAEFIKLAFSPHTSKIKRMDCLAVNIKNDMYVCRAFYQQMRWAEPDDWESIDCPVLMIHGEDDKLTPIHKAEALHKKFYSSGSMRILKAGHQVHLEQDAEVLSIINEFIRDTT